MGNDTSHSVISYYAPVAANNLSDRRFPAAAESSFPPPHGAAKA